jgi:RHS repeat-associated protein
MTAPRILLIWLLTIALVLSGIPITAAPALSRASSSVMPTKAQNDNPLHVFGPQRYDRLAGPPRNQTAQFALASTPLSAYTLRVENGDPQGGTNRVTGATIILNGQMVASAADLTPAAPILLRNVQLQTANSLSIRIIGAPRSYLTIAILIQPKINGFTPAMARAGAAIGIEGEGFDPRLPNRNVVRFAKAGGGTTQAQVNTVSSARLGVVVPSDAMTGPVTVEHEGGLATSPFPFEVQTSVAPVIADFAPKQGPAGTLVTLTGTGLKVGNGNPLVTFAGANNTRLPAEIASATPTDVKVSVPNAAVTGVIQLTTSSGMAVTSVPFTVAPSQEYTIALAPNSAVAAQGGIATFVVSLTSNTTTFTQLAKLEVTGAPSGVTASFTPQQIAAGATSTLNLVLPGPLATGSHSFTVRATAMVDASELVRTVGGSVMVQPAGQTAIVGRVLSNKDEPIMGATVSLDGKTSTSDAAGNFFLSGVTAGLDRPLMIDGRTASAPNRTYPVITEPATAIAGQATRIERPFYLPAIDTVNEVTIVPGHTTTVMTPKIPGMTMTIPANANLTNRDGSPVARVSLTTVELDRTPAPLPPNVGTTIVFTAQPGGARPASGVRIPVVYPNLGGADPGTRIELWSFNHDTVQWFVYGYGRVSSDGRQIVPEPGVGLPDFSWFFPNWPFGGCGATCCIDCPCPGGKKPVDYSSGVKIEKITDLSFGGARGGIEVTRTYVSNLVNSCPDCAFGRGTTHNYNIRLSGSFQIGGAGRLIQAGETDGRLFSYTRTDPDGALVFTTTATPHQLGDVIRKLSNGAFEYRQKNGDVKRFDTSMRMTSMVDRNGNTTTLEYTGSNLSRVTDPVGRSILLQYSGSQITQITDPINRVWRYAYDGSNRLISVTDPLGFATRYTYDMFSRLTSVIDKRGNTVKSLTYDGNSRVIEQRSADGGFERYSYTLSGNMVTGVTIVDALGRTESMRFNGAGQVIGLTDELGQSSEIERDLTTNLISERRGPCGCSEDQRQYDSRGNTTSITDRLGQTKRIEYEPVFNNVTKTTDKLGRVTIYAYDSRGNRISKTNALNQTTTFGYDSFGQMISMTDPLGHTKAFEYDAHSNNIASIDALGNRSTRLYDLIGRVTETADPLNRRTLLAYDALDRVIETTDSANVVTRLAYDANGNPVRITNALGNKWSSSFDAKNRPVSSADPLSHITRMQYNTDDEMIAKISPSGRTMRYDYDARGNEVMITDGLGGIVRYSYDNRGFMTMLTDQRGNSIAFAYDELYRPIRKRDPLGKDTTLQYDVEDNVIKVIDRLGRLTTFDYDSLNRLRQVNYVDAIVTYAYDAADRMTRIDDTISGRVGWVYDDIDRVLSEQASAGTVSYAYNAASQRESMTVGDRPPVRYSYDQAGRLQEITQAAETFTYVYDALSRTANFQRPNGVGTEYQYDNAGRLQRLTHRHIFNNLVEDFRYIYNEDGEIDSINSVTSAQLLPVAKVGVPANSANRLEQFGALVFSFDNEGQTTMRGSAQGVARYDWDARGRLTQITMPSDKIIKYRYDALGRRISREIDGVMTSFLYDGVEVLLDRKSDGSSVDYINGPNIDQKLRQTSQGGNLYFVHDHLGSTAAILDSSGAVVMRDNRYEPYGSRANNTLVRYGFTGREHEEESELIFYRARYYDSSCGRFISEDPIQEAGGMNLYRYVMNNPITYSDSFGLSTDGTYSDLSSLPRPLPIDIGEPFNPTNYVNYFIDSLMFWNAAVNGWGGEVPLRYRPIPTKPNPFFPPDNYRCYEDCWEKFLCKMNPVDLIKCWESCDKSRKKRPPNPRKPPPNPFNDILMDFAVKAAVKLVDPVFQ